jgi:FAD dependent oxidoreductase TIGR03364
MRQVDAIVVGAGVLGTFHAYFAALRGAKTLLIDRNPWPSDASTRNFGILARSLAAPTSVDAHLLRAGREIYLDLQRQHDISLRASGSLYLASTPAENAVLREFVASAPSDYTCQYLEAKEALDRFPFVQPEYCTGALLFPDDLSVEPRRLLKQLIPYVVEKQDVEYLPNTAIISVESNGSEATVKDARGETYRARRVILCAGAEYRTLFPGLFRRRGIKVCKLQMLQTAPQPGLTLPHALFSGLSIGRYPAFAACPSHRLLAGQPLAENLRNFGIHLLIRQLADGSLIVGDSHEYKDCANAAGLEETTNPAITAAILAYAARMVRVPALEPVALWNGYYLVLPGQDLFLESLDDVVHIALAGGKGMTLGPGFARQNVDTLLV